MIRSPLKIEGVADADSRLDGTRLRGRVTQESEKDICAETEASSDNGGTGTSAANRLYRTTNVHIGFGTERLRSCQRRKRSTAHIEANDTEAALSSIGERSHVRFVAASRQTMQE